MKTRALAMELLLLLFMWGFVCTECFYFPRGINGGKRGLGASRTQGGSCSAQFQNCVKSYFGLFDDFQRNYTNGSPILVDTDSAHELCTHSGTFHECLENVRAVCHSDIYWGSSRIHYYVSLVTYICSQEGITALLSTSGSRCDRTVNADRMRSKCEMETQRVYQLEKEISDKSKQKLHCSYVKDYRKCAVTAITQACGAALADFLEGIDHLVNEERYAYEKNLYGC